MYIYKSISFYVIGGIYLDYLKILMMFLHRTYGV